jgi:hypothetical protein
LKYFYIKYSIVLFRKQTSSKSIKVSAAKMSFQSIVNEKTDCYIPSKPYYLRETYAPLEEICEVTNNLSYVPAYFVNLHDDLALRRRVSQFGQFFAPSNYAVLNKVNGKYGFFLKKTIKETGIDFIWHDKEREQYLFWSPTKLRLIDAMNRIRSRIIKYVMHLPVAKISKKAQAPAVAQAPAPVAQTPVAQEEEEKLDEIEFSIFTPTPSPIQIRSVDVSVTDERGKKWWSPEEVASPSPAPIQLRPISVVNKKWFSRKEERLNRQISQTRQDLRLNYPDTDYRAAMLAASPPPLLPPKSAECCEKHPQGYCVHAQNWMQGKLKKPVASSSPSSSPFSTPPPVPEQTSPPPIMRSTSVAFRDDADYANMQQRGEYPFNRVCEYADEEDIWFS